MKKQSTSDEIIAELIEQNQTKNAALAAKQARLLKILMERKNSQGTDGQNPATDNPQTGKQTDES